MTTSISPLIGISGLQRSGKDTLAALCKENGYFTVSLGDIVREYSQERHHNSPDPISIAHMTETANWLRQQFGPDVVLQKGLQKYHQAAEQGSYKGLVLFSIRSPYEADWIVQQGGALIWVEASDDVRYARAMKALRPGEIRYTKAQYLAQEALQWKPQPGIAKDVQMDMQYVKQRASDTLINNGNDIAAFYDQAEKILARHTSER